MGIIKVLETIGQMSSDETSKDEACLGLKGGSFSEKWRYFSVSHCIPHTMYQHVSSLACEYMVVVQNSFFSKRPFLAEKKNYFSQTFAILTKNFRGAICVSWATIKTHSVAAAHSRVAFCLYRWSLLTFSGQFWHSPPKLRAHLLPASLETRHNKSTI